MWFKIGMHNQIKCMFLSERPRDSPLTKSAVFQTVNVSVCCYFSEAKKPTPPFQQHMIKSINQKHVHKVQLTGSAS